MSKIGYFNGVHAMNNVHSILDEHLKNNPELSALRWVSPDNLRNFKPGDTLEHESLNRQEFYEHIGHVAAGLKEIGIEKGDRVILFVPMSVHLYTAMFALQKIGAIPVFLDSWARREHLGAIANIVTPKAMISFEKAFAITADMPELASISVTVGVGPGTRECTAHLEELLRTPGIASKEPVEQEHTALVTFTTGSSGAPKGANRTHRFLAAQHTILDTCIPYVAGDVDLPVFPIFLLNNIAAGVGTVIPAFDIGVPADHDPEILLAQLQFCGVTCTTLSPSLFGRVSAYCLENEIELPNLRRVVTGGAPVSRDGVIDFQAVAPNARICILFGSTEVEPMAHIEGKELLSLETRTAEDPEWVDDGVNVGRIADGLNYRFLNIRKSPIEIRSARDWQGIEVSSGEVGELIVAGEHVCRNYYNDEEAFHRAKILDEAGVVWHRTGDLGRIDEHGFLWIVGRVHNTIQREGQYLFPVRAEMILKKLPFVHLAAYLGVPDAELGQKTVCAITPSASGLCGNPEMEARWKGEILRIMKKNGMPIDQVVFRDSIPMDPRHHSKVEYDTLLKELRSEGIV